MVLITRCTARRFHAASAEIAVARGIRIGNIMIREVIYFLVQLL
jgi:hypothetical protein